jgi:hypothetical protein
MDCEQPLAVDIGGFVFHYVAADSGLQSMLRERYRNFLTDGATPAATLLLDVTGTPVSDQADLEVTPIDARWRISRGDFVAEWHPATRTARVRQSRNPYSTDSVTRIICSFLLAGAPGFLLHASSLVWRDRAYVFCGPSGAGKTTMTRIAPKEARLLTDEISCLRKTNGVWHALGTPFAGELAISGDRISAPVAGVFRLQHAPDHRVEMLPTVEAVRAIMRNVLVFGHEPDLHARALDAVFDLASAVPTARLNFLPEPSVWAHIA